MTESVTIGNATLYCGDCREILPTLGRFDAVITDPPYGIGRDGGMGANKAFAKNIGGRIIKRKEYKNKFDKSRPDADLLRDVAADGDVAIIWGGNFFADVLPLGRRWLVWNKINQMPSFSDCELAWTSIAGTRVKMFTLGNGLTNGGKPIGSNSLDRYHPNQKPIRLMQWCIQQAGPVKTILDPFMGSGSTGVAALSMGLHFVGIEQHREYFDVACKRIRAVADQANLFEPLPYTSPETAALFDE